MNHNYKPKNQKYESTIIFKINAPVFFLLVDAA